MSIDRTRVYNVAEDFFNEEGSAIMKLTPPAAIEVCKTASSLGFIVVRVEGGILHYPGFEARLDCIWDSKIDPPVEEYQAKGNNKLAAEFIKLESTIHNAFIVTASPIGGWRHKQE